VTLACHGLVHYQLSSNAKNFFVPFIFTSYSIIVKHTNIILICSNFLGVWMVYLHTLALGGGEWLDVRLCSNNMVNCTKMASVQIVQKQCAVIEIISATRLCIIWCGSML